MAFRQVGSEGRDRLRTWHTWVERHAATLRSIGLPPEVYLNLLHWEDFLANGHLHWHAEDSTGFEFGELSAPQMQRLLAFLETQNDIGPEHSPLLGWLRVRLGVGPADR